MNLDPPIAAGLRRKIVTSPKRVFYWLVLLLTASILSSCDQESDVTIAFTNVKIVPMNIERVIEDQTVLIAGSEIVAVGDSSEIHIPKTADVIDGEGAFLMPGLADMHMHTRADWEDQEIWPEHPLSLYLANGVTTIRDFAPSGSPIDYALQWQKEINAGTRIGPTIYTSGILLYTSPLDDPAGLVDRNDALGFDFLKLYSYLSKDDFHQAMTESKALGMYTAGHIPYAVGLEGVLTEGMDEIAHVEELLFEFIKFDRDRQLAPEEWMAYIAESAMLQFNLDDSTYQADFEKENDALLQNIATQLRSAQVPVCTTMVIDDTIQLKLFQPDTFLARPENQYFESGYLESFQHGEEKHQVQCQGVEDLCAFKYMIDRWILQGLHSGDVLLLLGTDSGTGGMGIIPGYSIHDELHILVENGFTPYEALKTGTVNAAIVVDRMNGDGNFGTIKVGNRADLILVAENPLEKLDTIRTPLGVMAAGKWFSAELLNQLIEISDY
jgi:hypothetical protein